MKRIGLLSAFGVCVIGLGLGGQLGKRLSGPALQKVFASAIVAIAIFIIGKTFV